MNVLAIQLPDTVQEPTRERAATDVSARKRRANDYMRDGLAHYDQDEPIPFFCECSREPCFKPVWLTGGEFDDRRQGAGWLPIAAHDETDEMPIGRAIAGGDA
jgi:hypothetical protein